VQRGPAIGTEKYPALTGLRALGASIVFLDHFPLWPDAHITINVMAFFYALSGFLIVRIYYEHAALERVWLGKYFLNRFARIYPVYFLLLTIAVLLQQDFRPGVLLANYTLTHALFHNSTIIIPPSWSLTVEECFYLLCPLFMVVTKRRGFWLAFALAAALLAAALGISRLNISFLETPTFVLSTTFFGHFVEFFAGFFLALMVIRLEQRSPARAAGSTFTLLGAAGVTLLVVAMLLVYRHPPLNAMAIILLNNFVIPFPIAVLYWGLIREDTVLSRALSTRLAGLLGRSSYSFYVLHILVVDSIGERLLAWQPALRGWWILATFIATWLIAIGLFICYEEPLNLLIRRRFKSKTRAIGMPATLFRA
jgi:peptidoglycan/LPS O-acetylase OafA/YrhL